MKRSVLFGCFLAFTACSGDDGGDSGPSSSSTTGTTTVSTTSTGSTDSTTTGTATGTSTGGDSGSASTGSTGATTAATTGTDTGTAGGNGCEACIMTACAGPFGACIADQTCACWVDCLMQPGTDDATCEANCGAAPPLLLELASCMTANCADACQ